MARRSAPAPLQGSFRVEMLGSQESLDLDCGKFFTVRLAFLCVFCMVALRRVTMSDSRACLAEQEYILRCTWSERGGTPEIWDVVRRYREFCAIDILLREKYPSRAQLFPFLPSKKYIGSSLSADFVDKRQRDLGYYVSSILHSCPLLVQDEIVDSFLEIKRHILERAREQERKHISASPSTFTGSSHLLRVQE